MSDAALITMILTWAYILFFVLYFFFKILRKEREKKRNTAG